MELNFKICTKCDTEKPLSEYHKQKGQRFGVRNICKQCRKVETRKRYEENKDKISEQCKKYYSKNKDNIRKYLKNYREANLDAHNSRTAKYRADKLKRTPKWLDEEEFFIKEAYELAKLRERCTGIKWHVDHEIPLRGKNVSGLHVPQNIKVIPAKQNLEKSNKYAT